MEEPSTKASKSAIVEKVDQPSFVTTSQLIKNEASEEKTVEKVAPLVAVSEGVIKIEEVITTDTQEEIVTTAKPLLHHQQKLPPVTCCIIVDHDRLVEHRLAIDANSNFQPKLLLRLSNRPHKDRFRSFI